MLHEVRCIVIGGYYIIFILITLKYCAGYGIPKYSELPIRTLGQIYRGG